jgi:hypothetical protein
MIELNDKLKVVKYERLLSRLQICWGVGANLFKEKEMIAVNKDCMQWDWVNSNYYRSGSSRSEVRKKYD